MDTDDECFNCVELRTSIYRNFGGCFRNVFVTTPDIWLQKTASLEIFDDIFYRTTTVHVEQFGMLMS
uniref:Uncharacterized protein n=1 Tax=Romanomermis culicivorax TaxID=13658 RepID=A0A915IJD7_ROMCU